MLGAKLERNRGRLFNNSANCQMEVTRHGRYTKVFQLVQMYKGKEVIDGKGRRSIIPVLDKEGNRIPIPGKFKKIIHYVESKSIN